MEEGREERTEPEGRTVKDRVSSLAQRARGALTGRILRIVCLLTPVACVVALLDALNGLFPLPVSLALYVLAAVGLVATCTLAARAVSGAATSALQRLTASNRVANALATNARLRTVATTIPGTALNLVYAVFNGVVGIVSLSAWYGSLSAYYLLLCVMRFSAVSHARRAYALKGQGDEAQGGDQDDHDGQEGRADLAARDAHELTVYRTCGKLLAVSSIALGGAVIMVVLGYGGKSYAGLTIYAVATYTFCKLGVAIVNLVKVQRERSLLQKTLRNISYSDALVSLLALQTALFASFGEGVGDFEPTMNALTGAGVCLMIAGLGLSMVHDARRRQRAPQLEEEAEQ